jgi:hypothetical protein
MANPVKSGITGDKFQSWRFRIRVLFLGREDECQGIKAGLSDGPTRGGWPNKPNNEGYLYDLLNLISYIVGALQVVLCVYTIFNLMSSGIKTSVEIVGHQNYMVTH